ncbi:hypothetical protein EUTSA_v10027744mg [Eutrema salsugineum]|uniref:FBD domain-containing protein n=1 Tax=Eutrema salsugineum TaxID=72664 RepID=V4LSX5_EUTSA|nr:F-box/LRR-repeat protein At3g62440 [Eutrema salsugineum]ESQ46929.1 hypothetical protein EUTSA_v10027744mg [Eutrema salsugineum]
MDRISSLPDEIICHIGSFLSAKEAAFATVLSSQWRNEFTIIPKLHFDDDDDDDDDDREKFKDFVDRVLALPVSCRVRTFSIKWNHVAAQQDEQINRCLCHVLKRGVLVLELQISVLREGYYSLPFDVFTCKTVSEMKLGSGFVVDFLPADASLPALKTLFLDSVQFHDSGGRCAFKTLLSASPVLEELVMDGIELERWKWSCTVSSPTLQRLTIRRREWYSYDAPYVKLDSRCLAYDFDSVSLVTPGLTYLEYSDYVPKKYPIVDLNSLVEAKLFLCVDQEDVWREEHADNFDPMNLITGFKNVEILDLTIEAVEMFYVFHEAVPVFEKLVRLSLGLSNFCWFSVSTVLKKFPNLKTLIIKDSLHYGEREDGWICQCVSEYSFLLSCPVEVLKIKEYNGSIEELEQVKHFVEKMSCLELVEVHAQVAGDKKLQVMADLLMLPRGSSKCKIQVKFSRKRYSNPLL